MINIIRASFSTCKEKKKLHHFIKKCFIEQLPKIEDSVKHLKDISHTINVLKCLKNLKDVDQTAEVCKKTIKDIQLTNENMTPDKAVYLADSLFPFLQDSDLILYDSIYVYIQNNMTLFDRDQLKKLERTYYEVSQRIPLSTGIYLDKQDQIKGFANGVIQKDRLKLYGVNPDKSWSTVNVRNQEDTLTSHAFLKYDKINVHIQGIHQHDLKDLVLAKQFVTTDKQFCINLPPIDTDKMRTALQFLNYIDEKINSQQNIFEQHNQVSLDKKKLDQCVQILRKKYIMSEPELLFTGNFQGHEVPYNLESMLYFLSKREVDQIILTDLTYQERVNIIESVWAGNNQNHLEHFKLVWLTNVFDWSIDVTRQGCLNCSQNSMILPSPSDILDDYPVLKKIRVNFITSMLRHSISTKGPQKILLQQDLFWDVLTQLVGTPLVEHKTNIDVYRNQLLTQQNKVRSELIQFYNEQFIVINQGFETHQNQMEKKNKVKNNSTLDINQFSKEVWRNSHQLRCSPRDILF